MILKYLSIFSQNVCKNKLLTNTIFKNKKKFNILFIQELPWLVICQIPSSILEVGEDIISTSYHPSWIMFARSANSNSNYPRIITYINIKLISLCFSLRKDIFNHCNINPVSFFNWSAICFIMNMYFVSSNTACISSI